jgi:hypothetical protein
MTQYWFKPKRYGYGATPVTWEGWAVTLAAIVVVVAATLRLTTLSAVDLSFWLIVAIDAVAIVTLLIVSRRKTEGEWRWRWGDR